MKVTVIGAGGTCTPERVEGLIEQRSSRHDDGHRARGLCSVAPGLQRLFGELLHAEPASVELDAGLTPLTWGRSVRVAGRERGHELLAPPLPGEVAGRLGLSPRVLELLGAIPSDCLKHAYHSRRCVEQQRASPRAAEVRDIEDVDPLPDALAEAHPGPVPPN